MSRNILSQIYKVSNYSQMTFEMEAILRKELSLEKTIKFERWLHFAN